MSRARDFADLAASVDAGGLTGRNLIINGAMQVAQRGTSFTNPANTAYTLDRWKVTHIHGGAVDISQSTEAPVGFYNSLKVDVTTADASVAASDMYMVYQLVEDNTARHLEIGTSDAVSVSVSFWVRSSKTGTYCVNIKTNDSTRAFVSEYTINSANTWEKKEVSLTLDTTGSWYSANVALSLGFVIMAGTNYHISNETWTTTSSNFAPATSNQVNGLDSTANEWYITGVQLEIGETATPFEHRSFGDEMAKCQRYYYMHAYGGDAASASVGVGALYTGTILNCPVSFPVRMRAAPSLDHLNSSNAYRFWRDGTSDYFDNFAAFYDGHPMGGAMEATSNVSGTQGQVGRIVLGGSAAYIAFDAEL